MPRADLPMSNKQPTRSGARDFTFELLTTAILNQLKNLGIIDDFKGQGQNAKIKKPGKKTFTKVSAKANQNLLKKQFKKNPKAFQEEPEEKAEEPEEPQEELKDKPSDIARQRKEAEEARLKAQTEAKEAKGVEAPAEYLDHPLNKALIELKQETNPLNKKKILAKARQLYKKHKTQNSLPRRIVSQRGSQEPYRRNRDAMNLLSPAKGKQTSIDKARVLRSDLIDDIKQEGGLPQQDQQAFLYFLASAHTRDPDKFVSSYFNNRQAFMANILRLWQANDNKQAYSAMSQDGVDIDAMTERMVTSYETRVGFEEAKEEPPEQRRNPFQLPSDGQRMVLRPEIKQFQEDIDLANTDDEKQIAVNRFIDSPRVQAAARQAGNAARFINLIRSSPALTALTNNARDLLVGSVGGLTSVYFSGSAPPPQQQEQEQKQESDPVKVEAELRRLREQLTNLRTSKLNEVNEEQTFKKLRKFRPEIREFNPERLNYFISAENEQLEKKELIDFAYIPEVSQAGVYTKDYKDNPIVMGNIQNQDIRFSNTKKQPMDYHPVGTYMLLDRIGKQMSEIRMDFDRAVASMEHQKRVDDGMFNQVFIPRIPPVEQPRNRKYRDMGDPVNKFASEPIVSLPKIDDRGVGGTSAQRDFITSYSYRRHYIK